MNTDRTRNPSEHPIRRRLVAELLSVPHALFWLGTMWFALGLVIDCVPGGEESWFVVAAALTAFGLLIPRWWSRFAALGLVVLSILAAFDGHKRGIEYHQFLERKRAEMPSLLSNP
jgi:hypothetical protein